MKLKVFIPIIAIAILAAGCKPKDCSRFKTGTFRMMVNGKLDIIKRSPDFQTELLDTMKTPDTLMVKWLDNCTYTLTPTAYTLVKSPKVPKNLVLTVSIDATTDTSYTCTSTENVTDMVFKAEIIKISSSHN
jgi:hypothetical protein